MCSAVLRFCGLLGASLPIGKSILLHLYVSVSVVLAVTLLKEHLYSVRLVRLILIGVSTYTQIDQT